MGLLFSRPHIDNMPDIKPDWRRLFWNSSERRVLAYGRYYRGSCKFM